MMIKSPVLGKPPDTGNIGHNSVLPVHWTKALNRNLSASAGPAVRQGSGAHDNAGILYHTNILRNSKRILRYSQNVCLGDDQASFDRLFDIVTVNSGFCVSVTVRVSLTARAQTGHLSISPSSSVQC